MIIINKNQVYSSEGKYIHRIGTETYFKRGTVLKSDTVDNFEEIEELPKYTRQEYINKVRELIKEKYTIEDELAFHRQRDVKQDEFEEYNSFCESCKVKAKEILSNE